MPGQWRCGWSAGLLAGGSALFASLLIVPAVLLAWQVVTLDRAIPGNALARFKANHWVGLALTLAMLVDHWF